MEPKMTILIPVLNQFHLAGQHDQSTHGRRGSDGPDEQWSSYSENGRRRAADLEAGKEYKPLHKAKFDNELDGAANWPEKWIDENQRKTGTFAVPTFRKGARGLGSPASYDEAVHTHNLLEITRTGKNGEKEYLSPDANHLTARMKAIGLDKVVSPRELSRMVREDKPVWVDEESSMNYRFLKVPHLKDVEIGVGISDNGTIGTVIPGGYRTMAIQASDTNDSSKSQLGRLLYRDKVTQQAPSNETVSPTVPIEPVVVGKKTFKYPQKG